MGAPKFHYDEALTWFEVVTSRAAEVLQYVPGSAVVGAEDAGPVLRVPWSQHACEVLAQLRIPHLPPMLRDYTFAGTKTPYPHQYRIAGALSTHRKFFCLADMGCVDGSTEYLAPDGWHRIDSYTGGPVAQYHPDTQHAEFVEPTAYVDKPCSTMLHFKTRKGVDQMLSPEHRVLWQDPASGAFHVDSALYVAAQHVASERGFEGVFPASFGIVEGASCHAYRSKWLSLEADTPAEKQAAVTSVPAPGGRKYCFMVPSTFLVFRRNGYVFCSGNTGKTISSVWAIDYLIGIGAVKRVLVLCPKSIVRTAWLSEFNATTPHLGATVLIHADPAVRRRKAQNMSQIHIANYSAVEICYEEMVGRYDLIVIDESSAYKAYGTRRWKFLRPLVAGAARCWMLTGTPAVQYPLDAFGQVKLMYQDAWDMSESRFKMMTMVQHSKYRWVPLDGAEETVHEAMQPAIVIHKRDVLADLPPVTFSMRQVDLSAEQKRLMKELRKAAMVEMNGTTVSAVHAAALRTKLLQLASGSVYDDNGSVIDIDAKDRINEVVELCQQVRAQDDGRGPPAHKLMIVCAFTHTVERVQRELNAHGLKFGILHGGVSLKQREKILNSMQNDRELDGVVVQPEVVSHGVTLTSCTTTVFFTPFDKAEVALQVQNRMDRPGQKHPMQIIKLSGCPAEDLMYERLDKRIDFHQDVVSQYSDFVQAL